MSATSLNGITETKWINHHGKIRQVKVVARYEFKTAVRIVMGGEEWIVEASELIDTKPETQSEREDRIKYQDLRNQVAPHLKDPKTLAELQAVMGGGDGWRCWVAVLGGGVGLYSQLEALRRRGHLWLRENKWGLFEKK